MRVALKLRSLRFHTPRLFRVAVFLIQTNASLPPFLSHHGLFHTNQRLSLKIRGAAILPNGPCGHLSDTADRCIKMTSSIASAKACTQKDSCAVAEALVELALALDDGSDAAETAEMKSFKRYECAGEVCNSATGLYAGAWTAVLASIVALVNVHYQVITLNYGALASVTFGWRCGLMTDMCSSGSMCACMCSVLFDPSILSSFLRARGWPPCGAAGRSSRR